MKSLFIILAMLVVLASAIPISEVPETDASIALAQLQKPKKGRHCSKADFKRLMFESSLEQFQKARKARKPRNCDFTSNGCTSVPDRPLGKFDFTPACERHDFGYVNAAKRGCLTSHLRKRIDKQFQADLYNQCEGFHPIKRFVCRRTSDLYYVGVRAFNRSDKFAKTTYDKATTVAKR